MVDADWRKPRRISRSKRFQVRLCFWLRRLSTFHHTSEARIGMRSWIVHSSGLHSSACAPIIRISGTHLLWDGLCIEGKLLANLLELVLPSLPHRLPKDSKLPVLFFPQIWVNPRKSKGLRFSLFAGKTTLAAKRPNSMRRVFSECSSRPNRANRSLIPVEILSVQLILKPRHPVVSEAHDDHFAACLVSAPPANPQVEYVMKVDVRQKRTDASTLHRSFFFRIRLPSPAHLRSTTSG